MAVKPILFMTLLVLAMAAPRIKAQLGLGNLLRLIHIQGTVFCTPNGNLGTNGTATPVFSNAEVQLECGGTVISSATRNASGIFSLILDPLDFVVSTSLSGSKLKIDTPLASRNPNLPAVGGLLSSLEFIGNTLLGLLNVANLKPAGFQFVP